MTVEQHYQESQTQREKEKSFDRERSRRRKGKEGQEVLRIEVSGVEALQNLFETLFRSLQEIRETGRVMGGMVKELPPEQRNELEERIAKLEQEILRQGEELVKANKARTALLAENAAFREENKRLKEEIARLSGEALKEVPEAEVEAPKEPEVKAPEAEAEAPKTEAEAPGAEAKEKKQEEQKPVEVVIEPEVVRQIREEILREIQENNEKRRELLKEKRVLGQEFTKLYTEISRFIQTDPMAMVLYSKWFKRLMKGREKEGEEFYQQGEALPQMQRFNFREAELKKRWEEIHQELDDLNSRNRNLRDALARIFSENLERIRIKTKPAETKLPATEETKLPATAETKLPATAETKLPEAEETEPSEPPEPSEAEVLSREEREELLKEQLRNFEAQQNLANLFLEKVQEEAQEPSTSQIPVLEIRPSETIIETSEADIIPEEDEEVSPPPLPLETQQEMKKQEKEKNRQVRKLFEDLKGRDPEKIVGAFDILLKKINSNPDYQEILVSQLSSELETFNLKSEDEAYLQNLIIIAGETKDKSFWPKLFAYLFRKDISQTSKFFITQSLYRIDNDRFLEEAENIYEKGGEGAAEAVVEIANGDKRLRLKSQEEGWLPPALPRVSLKKINREKDEEGIVWSGRSEEDIRREDEERQQRQKQRRLKLLEEEERIEFPEEGKQEEEKKEKEMKKSGVFGRVFKKVFKKAA